MPIRRLCYVILLLSLAVGACQPVSEAPGASLPPVTETDPPPPTATPEPVAEATPAATRVVELTIVEEEIESQALAGNLLGDPTNRRFNVMLPPDYADSTARYPTVYVLHGFYGSHNENLYDIETALVEAYQNWTLPEMIVVFVDGSNRLGGSHYRSSAAIGDYETYLTQEIVDFVDANYRTLATAESRAITGCSMGGDGAMHLAMAYPTVFGAVAADSGTYDWVNDPWLERARANYREPVINDKLFRAQPHQLQWALSQAAALTPNPAAPEFYLDQPVEMQNGEPQIAPAFLDALAAAAPLHEAEQYAAQDERLNGILIYHGLSDYSAPLELAQAFSTRLTELGIEHELVEAQAGHCTGEWLPILRFLAEHMAVEEG